MSVTPLAIMESRIPAIKTYLESLGGVVLEPTRPDELLRFKDGIQIGSIMAEGDYFKAKGAAINLVKAINEGTRWKSGDFKGVGAAMEPRQAEFSVIKRAQEAGSYQRKRITEVDALLARDGSLCFLCHCELGEDVTREHLLALKHGGPDVVANMVLAHGDCNKKLGHLAIMDKIRLREAYRNMAAIRISLTTKKEVAEVLSIEHNRGVETRSVT